MLPLDTIYTVREWAHNQHLQYFDLPNNRILVQCNSETQAERLSKSLTGDLRLEKLAGKAVYITKK